MKNKLLLAAVSFCFLLSCSNKLITLENGRKIDSKLVGTWVGSEKDKQMEGLEKSWEMIRYSDGTFVLDFKITIEGETNSTLEKGNWWVEKGLFYEFHQVSGKTDIYNYKILDDDRIKFLSKHMSMEMNNEIYEFIDTRKK